MPLVTIIIRTQGRRPQQLQRAVRSACEQKGETPEVLVIEDGGDTMAPVVEPLGARHVPLAKVGRSAAGNAGMRVAQGAFLGFLDDDDWLLPQHLATLVPVLLQKPQIAATYALAEEIAVAATPEKIIRRRIFGTVPFQRGSLWLRNLFPIQTVLFRRSLFETSGGFDETLDALEDWDLWLRYSQIQPFFGVAEVTSAFTIPASRKALRERAAAHADYHRKVVEKHAADSAFFSLAEIQALQRDMLENLEQQVGLARIGRYLRRRLFGI